MFTKAEGAGDVDMLGLHALELRVAIGLSVDELFHAHGDALLVEFVPTDFVHGDGVGREVHRLVLPDVLGFGGIESGTAVIEGFDGVADVKDVLVAEDGNRARGGDEGSAGVEHRGRVGAIDVVHHAVGDILQGHGDAGGLVVLQEADVDDLVDFGGGPLGDVGAAGAFVREVETGQGELHVHPVVGVVAVHALLDVVDVVGGVGVAGAFDPFAEAGLVELALVTVVEDDVGTLDAGGFEAEDDFLNGFGRGDDVGAGDRIQLDADAFAFLEEGAPGVLPGGGAGEFGHAATEHVADGLALEGSVDDGAGVLDGDDAAPERSGHGELGGGGVGVRRGPPGEGLREGGAGDADPEHAFHPVSAGFAPLVQGPVERFASQEVHGDIIGAMASIKPSRRELAQGLSVAALSRRVMAQTSSASGTGVPTRVLGRTGQRVSILCLGGWHIGSVKDEKEAIRIMHAAIDGGLTFFDNAWDYHDGHSEEVMGKALAMDKRRDKVFLMTKNCDRDYAGSMKHLEDSLRRLKTDHLDLWQFHECNYDNDPDWVFEKGGMKAALEARKAGKVRYIGFTGHKDPRIHLKMLGQKFDWDTAQMPINVLDAHFRSFQNTVVPECLKKNVGVIGMKGLAGGATEGRLIEKLGATSDECYRFCLSVPVATQVVGITKMSQLEQNLKLVRNFKPLTKPEREAFAVRFKEVASDGRHEWFKSTQFYDGPYHRKQHGFDLA